MQGNGADMALVEMLMHLEQIGFVVEACAQGLAQGGQSVAGDDHYRSMNLGDDADRLCYALDRIYSVHLRSTRLLVRTHERDAQIPGTARLVSDFSMLTPTPK